MMCFEILKTKGVSNALLVLFHPAKKVRETGASNFNYEKCTDEIFSNKQ